MNQAGIVAILALVAAILRILCSHVVILPGVVVPVAGLVFVTILAATACFAWWMIHRIRAERRSRPAWCAGVSS